VRTACAPRRTLRQELAEQLYDLLGAILLEVSKGTSADEGGVIGGRFLPEASGKPETNRPL
jgi:hypothetical protein